MVPSLIACCVAVVFMWSLYHGGGTLFAQKCFCLFVDIPCTFSISRVIDETSGFCQSSGCNLEHSCIGEKVHIKERRAMATVENCFRLNKIVKGFCFHVVL